MYFDLHCHPSFKPYLTNFLADQKDHCWNTYNSIGGMLDSQSSLEQLRDGKVQLATATIYVMEKGMSTNFMVRYVVPALTNMDPRMLDTLPSANYFDRLNEEIEHLLKSRDHNVANGEHFNVISDISEIIPDKLNLVLAIEGGYGLTTIGKTLKDKMLELKKGPHKFLYMTLVHATQFKDYCTHAFSLKMIKNNPEFKPKGYGFAKEGLDIIDLAYDSTQGNRILIDVKHMSLVSRRQFYHHRKTNNYENIPIIASHMGFTGISWTGESISAYVKGREATEDMGYVQVLYERPEGIGKTKKTHFNPWSLNLYNEEIPIILDSGGLIGFNLDQRILGADPVKGEFFSTEEFEDIIENRVRLVPGEFEDEPITEAERDVTREILGINVIKHLRHLCNQILHVIAQGGPRAWDHICIGSDFDGLINPINGCMNSTEFVDLEKGLIDMLPKMIEEAEDLYPEFDFEAGDIKMRVRNLMYDNAINFLKKHF